ncbi:MAG: hypothetical protein SFU87_01550 [Chitinophagaceae bacterium]|nr:hypothetical protein [Chitinophagaceae bacterium]
MAFAHPMPKNPTLEQRIKWHIEQARQCACREIPATIKKEIEKRKARNPAIKTSGVKQKINKRIWDVI